ncbi:uncharacterized protein LOC122810285 [Protopterus annectens]|uniref:uncharacterized protein LOC122810285 n=1 Tax=Protopterus annectens TaxID=7888 RepID=UPI001CFB18BC|nr:uncharacterized protein LOC122810285 [Protopterus annectens]XP_043937768.1 uncharacterized protein LOC122810285 [Protopterus annectens]
MGGRFSKKKREYTLNDPQSQESESVADSSCVDAEEQKTQDETFEASSAAPSHASKETVEQKTQAATVEASEAAPLHASKDTVEQKTQAVTVKASEATPFHASKDTVEQKTQAVTDEVSEAASLHTRKETVEMKTQAVTVAASEAAPLPARKETVEPAAPLHTSKGTVEQKTQAVTDKASEAAPLHTRKETLEPKMQAVTVASSEAAPLHAKKETVEPKTQAVTVAASEAAPLPARKETVEPKTQAVTIVASEAAHLHTSKDTVEQKTQAVTDEASEATPLHTGKETVKPKTQAVTDEASEAARSHASKDTVEQKMQAVTDEASEATPLHTQKETVELKTQAATVAASEAAPLPARKETVEPKTQAVTIVASEAAPSHASKDTVEQKTRAVTVAASEAAPLPARKETVEQKTQAVTIVASEAAPVHTRKETMEPKMQAVTDEASEAAPSHASKDTVEQKMQAVTDEASEATPLHTRKETVELKTQAVTVAASEAAPLHAKKESVELKTQAATVAASEAAPLQDASKKAEEQRTLGVSQEVAHSHGNKETEEQKTQAVTVQTSEPVAPPYTSKEDEQKTQDAVEVNEAVALLSAGKEVEDQKMQNAAVNEMAAAETESVKKISVLSDHTESYVHNETKLTISHEEDHTNHENELKENENVQSQIAESAVNVELFQNDQHVESKVNLDSVASPEKTLKDEKAQQVERLTDASTDVAAFTCLETEYAEQINEHLGKGAVNDLEDDKPIVTTYTFKKDLLSHTSKKEILEISMEPPTSKCSQPLDTEENAAKISSVKLLPTEVKVAAELEMVYLNKEELPYQKNDNLIESPTELHQESDCNRLLKSDHEAATEQKLEHLCSGPDDPENTVAGYVYSSSDQVKEENLTEEITGDKMLMTTDDEILVTTDMTASCEPPLQGIELCANKITVEVKSHESTLDTFEEQGCLDAKGNYLFSQICKLENSQTGMAKERTCSPSAGDDSIHLNLCDSSGKPSSPADVHSGTQSLHVAVLKSDTFPERTAETNGTLHLEHKVENEESIPLSSNMGAETSNRKFEILGEKVNCALHKESEEYLTNVIDFGGKADEQIITEVQDWALENSQSFLTDAVPGSVQECTLSEESENCNKDHKALKEQTELFNTPNIHPNINSEMELEGNLYIDSSAGKNDAIVEAVEIMQASSERELATEPKAEKLESHHPTLRNIEVEELGKEEAVTDTEEITQKDGTIFTEDNLLGKKEILLADTELNRKDIVDTLLCEREISKTDLEVRKNLTEAAVGALNHEDTDITGVGEVMLESAGN